MMSNSRSSILWSVALALALQGAASTQTHPDPLAADLCKVVASPAEYNGKVLSVEGVLLPSEHSVLLYSASCKPKENFDVGIEAVFPPEWVSLPNGKQLRKLLRRGKSASVKLSGTFETGAGRYGPDAAPFRFTITGILSIAKPLSDATPNQ